MVSKPKPIPPTPRPGDCNMWLTTKMCMETACGDANEASCSQTHRHKKHEAECQMCFPRNETALREHCCEREKREERTFYILGALFLALLAAGILYLLLKDGWNKWKRYKQEKLANKAIEKRRENQRGCVKQAPVRQHDQDASNMHNRKGSARNRHGVHGANETDTMQQHWLYPVFTPRSRHLQYVMDIENSDLPFKVHTLDPRTEAGQTVYQHSSLRLWRRFFANPRNRPDVVDLGGSDPNLIASTSLESRVPVIPPAILPVRQTHSNPYGSRSSSFNVGPADRSGVGERRPSDSSISRQSRSTIRRKPKSTTTRDEVG